MKFEPWVPSFMKKISEVWHKDRATDEGAHTLPSSEPIANPKAVYIYAINMQINTGAAPCPIGTIEVRSPRPLPYGRLLRIEDAE